MSSLDTRVRKSHRKLIKMATIIMVNGNQKHQGYGALHRWIVSVDGTIYMVNGKLPEYR